MGKTWLIFKHEYTRHVLRWRFLLALLSMPCVFLAAFICILISVALSFDRSPVGYVDQAKLMKISALPKEALAIIPYQFLSFPDELSARSALDRKEIQAYFVLPADYRETFRIRQVYRKKTNIQVERQFSDLLILNLLDGQAQNITNRVIEGPNLEVQAIAEKKPDRPSESTDGLIRAIIPIAMSYLLFGSVMSSAGYLTKTMVEEKENRTMEILATSTSPSAIMTGKILGTSAVGMTQLAAWCGLPLVGLVIIAPRFPALQSAIRWDTLLLILMTALFTFLLISTLLAMVGSTYTNASEGQQIASILILPAMLPYALINTILSAPSGPVALFLSFFPFTASITLLFRLSFSTVPIWQVLVSMGLIILSTIGAFWLAGRVFRIGMLRYGKRVSWKEILRAILPWRFRKEAA